MVRKRGLPAFETPWSRSIDPLCQGVGARPASRVMSHWVGTAAELLVGLQTGDGRPLPPHLKAQIDRELDRLEMAIEQIKAIEGELRHAIVAADTVTPVPRMLIELKGIGNEFATVLWTECLYRRFDNRRQVAP